jgi:hypothetical protein
VFSCFSVHFLTAAEKTAAARFPAQFLALFGVFFEHFAWETAISDAFFGENGENWTDWGENGPKMGENGTKMGENGTKMSENGWFLGNFGAKIAEIAAEMGEKARKMARKCLKMAILGAFGPISADFEGNLGLERRIFAWKVRKFVFFVVICVILRAFCRFRDFSRENFAVSCEIRALLEEKRAKSAENGANSIEIGEKSIEIGRNGPKSIKNGEKIIEKSRFSLWGLLFRSKTAENAPKTAENRSKTAEIAEICDSETEDPSFSPEKWEISRFSAPEKKRILPRRRVFFNRNWDENESVSEFESLFFGGK